MKYLVQSLITTDDGISSVVDSIKTDDYKKIIDWLMQKHHNVNYYAYIAMEIESQSIVLKVENNKYY